MKQTLCDICMRPTVHVYSASTGTPGQVLSRPRYELCSVCYSAIWNFIEQLKSQRGAVIPYEGGDDVREEDG